jgi:hypothetical protein
MLTIEHYQIKHAKRLDTPLQLGVEPAASDLVEGQVDFLPEPAAKAAVHEGSGVDGAVVNSWQRIARLGNLEAAPNHAWQRRDYCHASYVGGTDRDTGDCIWATVQDYDRWPGACDGPRYVTGPVTVVGPDDFRLDSDNDGIGCE